MQAARARSFAGRIVLIRIRAPTINDVRKPSNRPVDRQPACHRSNIRQMEMTKPPDGPPDILPGSGLSLD
jgi:hypothetical protein